MNELENVSRRRALRALGAAAAAATLWKAPLAHAQANAPRILVGSSAGSIPDVVARRYAERLGAQAGRPVLVENRVGAAGQVAIGTLRSSPPDGSTMLLAPGAVATVYPAIYPRLGYDAGKDLVPVSLAAELHLAFGVGPAVPESVKSATDFVAWARATTGQATFGSPGAGTPPHLLGALFASRAGIALQHVPYQGGPPAVVDLMGGRISAVFLPEGLLRQQHAARSVRVLATSGTGRSGFLPDVPTFVEQGFADVVLREWFAFFLPGGASDATVERAAASVRQAAADAELTSALAGLAMVATASSPAQMADRIAAERQHWTPIIRAAGITIDS
jgi:tripartite-type tricarboxylate transporter receptor subunit TctC